MAQAYLQMFLKDKAKVYSAGIEAHGLNYRAVAIMKEDGIDISHHTSNVVEEYKHLIFDYVLTVCDHAREVCPWFPSNAIKLHHSFKDPAKAKGTDDEISLIFREVRTEIKDYCKNLAQEIG